MTTNTVRLHAADDAGKLLLRVALGTLILLHGIAKIVGGPGFVLGLMDQIGMPAVFGYLVYVGEVFAPILVVAGVWTRLAAVVIAINMVVAVALVHGKELLSLGKTGGWALELQGMFFIAAVVVALQGAGRYSIGGSRGCWN